MLLTLGDTASLAAQLPIDPARIDGRRDSMIVRAGSATIGWQTYQMVRTPDGFRFVDDVSLGGFGYQRTEVLLARDGRIRWIQQGGVTMDVPIRASLEYRRNRVRGVTVVASRGGPITVESDTLLPAGTIDDNSIALYLPTLPWAEGARWTFPVFIGGENMVREMTLQVIGAATVALPSGPVETWQAELTGGNAQMRFYITKATPHRVARYELVGSNLEFILVN